MITEEYLKNMADSCKGSGKTFAEFLAETLKDKIIEIYLGDSYEEISTEQVSISYPAVFCGKIVAAYRECLVISSIYVDKRKSIKSGNLIFINERAIRALCQVNGEGFLEDMFLRSRESVHVMKAFA